MEFEDVLTITTPEGIDVKLALAGVGSRFSAALVDALIQGIVIGGVAVVLSSSGTLQGWILAGYAIVVFVVFFGYHVVFEVLASGRSPGKRLNGLRVVRVGGFPVGFLASAIRNTIRLIDYLPSAYLLGCIAILVSEKNQRLGDMAAGTLVVRERKATSALPPPRPAAMTYAHPSWDVGTITAAELATVRKFLDRRESIDSQARAELANTLSERLRPKVGGAPADLRGEAFLQSIVDAKSAREI